MADFPQTIWLVRHGESLGNIARRKAEAENAKTITSPYREPDVELSPLGVEQSEALGRWFAASGKTPTILFSSPYTRTVQTTNSMLSATGIYHQDIRIKYDERLRERELGVFDRLTKIGALEKFPDLCDLRERWGKFYFRPPGGESWADVIIRLRNFIETDLSRLPDERILIVTHEVIVRCFRYIIEEMTEQEIMAIDAASDVRNGGVTSYERCAETGRYTLELDNFCVSNDE
jgi:broad specificity phosphatase PhoE